MFAASTFLLLRPQHPEDELPFLERLVVSVRLSGTGKQPILLQLDSGSDGPILYPGSDQPEVQALVQSATLQGANTTDAQRAFAVLARPQNMQIGNLRLKCCSIGFGLRPRIPLNPYKWGTLKSQFHGFSYASARRSEAQNSERLRTAPHPLIRLLA